MVSTKSSATPLSLRRLTALYLAGLLLIAGISGEFRIIFAQHFQRDNRLAYLINVSGRQRMLSQRVAGLVSAYAMGDVSAQAPLLAAANELLANQQELETRNRNNRALDAGALRIRQIYFDGPVPLSAVVRKYVAEARQIAALPPASPRAAPLRADIMAQARAPLLAALNEVVTIHQQQTERALSRLNKIESIS
jgi:hypothetical protein